MNWLRKLIARTRCATPWNRPKIKNEICDEQLKLRPYQREAFETVLRKQLEKKIAERTESMLRDTSTDTLLKWHELDKCQKRRDAAEHARHEHRIKNSIAEIELHTKNAQLRAHLNWKG